MESAQAILEVRKHIQSAEAGQMESPEKIPPVLNYSIIVPNAPELPLFHANALNVRYGVDEFFLTLAVAPPPEYRDPSEVPENPQITAEPLCRFAVSRQSMQKFIDLMITQFNNQTAMLQGLSQEGSGE